MENVHGKTYSLLIDSYVKDPQEQLDLYNAVVTNKAIKKKADWALKWISSSDSFATRLIAFAIVEGIFFSGAFCSIYWIRTKGILDGLTQSNEYIARDEGLHCLFAVLLYTKYIVNKLPEDVVHDIFREAIDIEKYFINEALPCRLIGMNAELMSQYIEFCGDRLLHQLGYKKIFNVRNPFAFMDNIGIDKVTNFFEKRATEYNQPQISIKAELVPEDDF
jgi:ribonucleoside-diphosphate reductase beta chain